MPTLAEQYEQDARQRAALRRAMGKETQDMIAKLLADRLRRIRDISDEEWRQAAEEDSLDATA
jgi:hypothetical protein